MRETGARIILILVLGMLVGSLHAQSPFSHLRIPSEPDHFEDYEPRLERLVAGTMPLLEPGLRAKLLGVASSGGSLEVLDEHELSLLIDAIDRAGERGLALDLFLHESRILDIVPESAASIRTLVHDCLLLFLELSSDARQSERLAAFTRIPRDSPRGERILAFLAKTPTLQKVGQMVARNPALDEDVRLALQDLENGIVTSTPAELEAVVRSDWSEDPSSARCRAEFADHILAEASVGAVMRAEVGRGDSPLQPAVAKIIKPYAVRNLTEELEILSKIIDYLHASGEAYGLGATTFTDLFAEVRAALSKEIRVAEEQRNLRRAKAYYDRVEGVVVPAVLDCSTENATFMNFIEGRKITDAYSGEDERRRLAERMSDVMTYDVLFSSTDQAIFHGDPHAGNVLASPSPRDRYRLGLIDWGLLGTLERAQRVRLIQLLLGLYLDDRERLVSNIDSLVHIDLDSLDASERSLLDELIHRAVDEREEDDSLFDTLESLVAALGQRGYSLRYNVTLYVKSQVTMEGILYELDPGFRQDRRVMSRLRRRAFREFPKRLGRTVWFPSWHSRDYGSLLSNEDLKDIQWFRLKRGFRWLGRGIWTVISAPARLW